MSSQMSVCKRAAQTRNIFQTQILLWDKVENQWKICFISRVLMSSHATDIYRCDLLPHEASGQVNHALLFAMFRFASGSGHPQSGVNSILPGGRSTSVQQYYQQALH